MRFARLLPTPLILAVCAAFLSTSARAQEVLVEAGDDSLTQEEKRAADKEWDDLVAKPGEALTIEPLRQGGLLESKINTVSLMGGDKKLDFEVGDEGLKTTLPAELASPIASVLKIETAGL